MPKINFYHIGYITEINADKTHHIVWYNAVAETVRSFSVDAHVLPPFLNAPACMEVVRVEYRQTTFNGQREIHFWIKNTGSFKAAYAVHMTTIQE